MIAKYYMDYGFKALYKVYTCLGKCKVIVKAVFYYIFFLKIINMVFIPVMVLHKTSTYLLL